MEEQTIHAVTLEVDGAVATLTFNRPEQRNSLSDALVAQSLDAIEQLIDTPEVRVLVLTGAGTHFSVGGDLDKFSAGEFTSEGMPLEASVRELVGATQLSVQLRESRLLTIAAVRGACAGAGLSIAAACDLRVASDTSVFRTAFLDAGLSGDFGGTWLLTRLLGEAQAKELFLLNEKFDAAEALRIGLVTRVFTDDELMAGALILAEQLAAKPPIALRHVKQNLTDTTPDFSLAIGREAYRNIVSGRTADAVEAATAFLEKRAPVFTGK